jgi:hypothetical protein
LYFNHLNWIVVQTENYGLERWGSVSSKNAHVNNKC